MSFSPKLLANIKHARDSDLEDAEEEEDNENSLLATLKTFPETANDSMVVEILPAGENFKQEVPDACIDPLLNNAVVSYTQNSFANAYQDSDILRSDESDDDNNATSRTNKKMRLQAGLKGCNGYTWSTIKENSSANSSYESALLTLQPKCKGPAQTINNILEIWSLLIDEQIIGQIVTNTNIGIKKQKLKWPGPRLIDAVELRAWIGLNYLCGIFRNATHNGPLDELWSLELGNAIFRATMPLKRFEFIMENLSFGDANSKEDSNVVTNVWSKFLINCRSYYAPSGNCCVDEVYMTYNNTKGTPPSVLVMCDVKTLYMCNSVFCKSGEYRERDVLRIVSDIKGSKRNIVLPTQLTNIDLANKLCQMETSVIGIVPNLAKEIPPEFITNGTIDNLYSETVTLRKCVQNLAILLNSRSLDKRIRVEHLYRLSCDACQNYQKSASLYSTIHAATQQPDGNSWPMNFFQNILDYAIVNAWILFSLSTNGDSTMKQRDFQRHLGLYLTQQQLKRQLQSGRLALPQKVQISEVLGEPTDELFAKATANVQKNIKVDYIPHEKLKVPDGVQILTKNLPSRLRCRKCPSRKTKTRCQQCLMPLCQRHFVQRCRDCTGLPELEKDTEEAHHAAMSDSDGDGDQERDKSGSLNFNSE